MMYWLLEKPKSEFTLLDNVLIYVIVIVVFILLLKLLGSILNSKPVRKKIIAYHAAYVADIDARGARKGENYAHAKSEVMKYMEKEGILKMKVKTSYGETTVEYIEEKKKEDEPGVKTLRVLMDMEYSLEQAEAMLAKAFEKLGTKAKFDELLNHCLNQRKSL